MLFFARGKGTFNLVSIKNSKRKPPSRHCAVVNLSGFMRSRVAASFQLLLLSGACVQNAVFLYFFISFVIFSAKDADISPRKGAKWRRLLDIWFVEAHRTANRGVIAASSNTDDTFQLETLKLHCKAVDVCLFVCLLLHLSIYLSDEFLLLLPTFVQQY